MTKSVIHDDHGQPVIRTFNAKRLTDRSIDELIGLSKGIAADEIATQGEAEFLLKWIEANRNIADQWPVNAIYARLKDMLIDGILDQDEQKELLEIITNFTGQIPPAEEIANMSTALPIDSPPPELVIPGRTFCFTGKFVCGSRKDCQNAVVVTGGLVAKSLTMATNYLVIGMVGSKDWIHTSYGRKIEQAVEMKNQGRNIHIVAEDHWIQYIQPS